MVDPITVTKIWLMVKPFKRWKESRARKRMQIDLGTRTSTNSGIAGVVAIMVMSTLKYVAPDFSPPEGFEAGITALVMWVIARFSKSPSEYRVL